MKEPIAPMQIATGGRAIYGARIGILMLEAQFPRIPGDMGNAETWPFPVLYKVVRGASPDVIVRQRGGEMLGAFQAAAAELVADGADGITTNCGFLSLFQAELAAHCHVPVATSALMQAPLIQRLLPVDQTVGIITISASHLSVDHLRAAGVASGTPVVGTDSGREFSRAILNNEPELNVAAARDDILDAGRELLAHHPEVGAVLLECTNMGPYSADLQQELRLPVFDIVSFVRWFHSSLAPSRFLFG